MANKAIENLLTRKSLRFFSSRKVKEEKIDQIIECAIKAPSGVNSQSPRFLVIQDSKMIAKLKRLSQKVMNRVVFYDAKTIILVYANKNTSPLYVQDCSCALQNIFLAANALKIGSCWINQFEELLSSTKDGLKMRELLGLTSDDVVVGTAALGYPQKDVKYREIVVDQSRVRKI